LRRASVASRSLRHRAVETFQFFEAEAARAARRDVQSDLRRFDEQGAPAAHGVEQRGARLPSGEPEYAGGKIFLERRFARGGPRAALVERLARRVQV